MKHTTTSLVLGSGGARGLTHIGVIRCLVERGYDIRYVAGSSIGALIGGIHAAGQLDTYAKWVGALQRSDVLRLLDLSLGGNAIFKGERVIGVLRELIGDHTIESLPIGFTAVATDLSQDGAGREVWLNRGPLFDAIRASIAVPTIFEPVITGHQLLVDGSVVNPVPIGPTLNDRTAMTIAVDLNGRHEYLVPKAPAPAPEPTGPLAEYQLQISRFVDRFWPAPAAIGPLKPGFSDLVLRSMETMQASITQFKLAATPPAVVIRMPRNLCSFFDFHRAEELIEFGHRRASDALAEYERMSPRQDAEANRP
ncbi:MAG: patatin-like phospholipase family protein [Burkholderiaceae bacterium]